MIVKLRRKNTRYPELSSHQPYVVISIEANDLRLLNDEGRPYLLSCFGGGFAIMPSFVMDVYGEKRMSVIYGIILTAWSAAGILGPLVVASLKDNYPDRAIIYSFLLGILVLSLGFSFSFSSTTIDSYLAGFSYRFLLMSYRR